jgi:hypothetical protein
MAPASKDRMDLAVIFTSPEATAAALEKAAAMGSRLGTRITLVVPQIVPYPLPLTSPPVLTSFQEQRLQALTAGVKVDATVQVYLCRDLWDAMKAAFRLPSLVVLGGRKRWWRAKEQRLAGKLRRAGHDVLFIDTEETYAGSSLPRRWFGRAARILGVHQGVRPAVAPGE